MGITKTKGVKMAEKLKTYEEMTDQELAQLDPSFVGVKSKLNMLKELGLDVSVLEEKISWSVKARQIMGSIKGK